MANPNGNPGNTSMAPYFDIYPWCNLCFQKGEQPREHQRVGEQDLPARYFVEHLYVDNLYLAKQPTSSSTALEKTDNKVSKQQ